MEELKAAIDVLARPPWLFSLTVALLLVMVRSRPPWRSTGGLALLIPVVGGLALALSDPVFRTRALEPERLPVLVLAVAAAALIWTSIHRAHAAAPEPTPWSGIAAAEWLLGCGAILTVGLAALLVDLPLERAPDISRPPLGPRAPWFLLAFEELGRYFDAPAIRLLMPVLVVATLVALPFLDRGGRDGGGFEDRRGMLTLGLFAIVALALLPMLIGAFLRGPHGLAHGPFAVWDPDRPRLPPTLPLSDLVWGRWLDLAPRSIVLRELPGLLFLVLYFVVLPWQLPRWRPTRAVLGRLLSVQGRARYHFGMALVLLMLIVPIKMYGRWLFGVDCLLHLPEWWIHL